MITTIQIDLQTKKKLFAVITKLQQVFERRVSYSEAIEYLLQKNSDSLAQKDYTSLYELKGLLKPGEGRQLLKQLRDEDHEREQQLSSR